MISTKPVPVSLVLEDVAFWKLTATSLEFGDYSVSMPRCDLPQAGEIRYALHAWAMVGGFGKIISNSYWIQSTSFRIMHEKEGRTHDSLI